MSLPAKRRVLVFDEDTAFAALVSDWLRGAAYEPMVASDLAQAERLLADGAVIAALIATRGGNDPGRALFDLVRDGKRGIATLLLDSDPSLDTAVGMFRAGASDYIAKPVDAEELVRAVGRCLSRVWRDDEILLSARLFENSAEGIMITDRFGSLLRVNHAFEQITGYKEADVLGRNAQFLQSGRHTRAFFDAFWASLERTGSWQGEMWNRRQNGEIYPQWLSVSTVRNVQGEVIHYLGLFSDITDKKALEDKLHHQAHHDALTDLPNRVLLMDRIEQALTRAARDHSQVAVLFLDLDRFKAINDSLGHAAGDVFLRETARRLRACLRASDTVVRLGGDEFTVVIQDLDSRGDVSAEISAVARKSLDAIAAPFLLHGHEVHVTTSIGAAVYPRDGRSRDDLLRNADSAMYHAKARGRNNFQFYSRELNEAAMERFQLEGRLRRAIGRGQLSVLYQPQVQVSTSRVVGCEVLLRWHDPEHGAIPPDRFIPIAEETGLIHSIGRWVLETACQRGKSWRAAYRTGLRLAVNLSAHQFHHPTMIDDLRAILDDTGFDPSGLELEITEGVLLRDIERTQVTLSALSDMGVRLTIDDFGMGYSSLSYLKRFPVDRLKIDRSFIYDIGQDVDSSAIVGGIINLAHGLSLEVIAEGVERVEQVEFLREHGCDVVQGYLFSEPLREDRFEDGLRRGASPREGPLTETAPWVPQ